MKVYEEKRIRGEGIVKHGLWHEAFLATLLTNSLPLPSFITVYQTYCQAIAFILDIFQNINCNTA